jgi:hypothetical protein
MVSCGVVLARPYPVRNVTYYSVFSFSAAYGSYGVSVIFLIQNGFFMNT